MATKEEILNTFDSREGAWWAYKEGYNQGYIESINSLRNQAAIAAMQGLMHRHDSCKTIARLAVEQADALIEELKKKHL